MSTRIHRLRTLLAAVGVAFAALPAFAQGPVGTLFTYQGKLSQLGSAASGTYDLRFRLYDSGAGGNQIGPTLCVDNLAVLNGAVTASLDFGAAFNGQQRFLEILVRADAGQGCADDTGFEALSPRQALTATPYSAFALSAASAGNASTLGGQAGSFYRNAGNLTGTMPEVVLPANAARLNANQAFTGAVSFSNPASTFAGTASNASALNGQPASFYLNAGNLTGLLSDARLSSNVARLNANQTFTGVVSLTNASNAISGVFSGSGAGLTSLNGANIAAGSLVRSALSADVKGGLVNLTGDWTVTPYVAAGTTVLGGRTFGIDAGGGRLYTFASDQPLLQVWSLSNPVAPSVIGSAATGGVGVGLAVDGQHVYIANLSTNRLQVFSVSNPSAPALVGDVATDPGPRSITIAGTRAYVVCFASEAPPTVQIFDVSTPQLPVFLGRVQAGATTGSISRVALSGTNVFWTSFSDGTLVSADVSNPQAPAVVGTVSVGQFPGPVLAQGQHLYVGMATTPVIRVYSLSNPAAPTFVGTVATTAPLSTLRSEGGFLYALTGGPKTVQVFSLSTPSAPALVGSIALSADGSDPIGLAIVGSNAYATTLSFSTPSQNTIQVLSSGNRVSFTGPLAPSVLSGADGSGLTNVNASSLATGTLSNSRTTGTEANTSSTLVLRDASGNFSAGTITANLIGNASTATSAVTANSANTAGNAALLEGQPGAFYTSASNLNAGTLANERTTGTSANSGGTLVLRDATGDFSAGTITASLNGNATSATTASTATSATQLNGQPASFYTNASNIASGTLANARTTGTNLNTASTLVLRDASGNFSAGTITANLNGNASAATSATTANLATNATQLNGQPASFYTSASNLSAGTLPDARLSPSIPRLNTNNTFTSTQNSFAGRLGVNTPAGALELDVNGRINVASGVIQKDLSAGVVTGTTDLGLYSQIAGGWIRMVTNNAQFAWFSDSGAGTTPRMILSPTGNLSVTGSLSKGGGSFKIDHPLDPKNKYLYHSFVESPDMMNIYNGIITTDERGLAVVELPDYFEALNRDFRYQLTVLDESEDDFILTKVYREIGREAPRRFTIKSSMPNTKVSWQVTGIRKDAWAEKNRIPNSVEKPAAEKGRYLHPEAFANPVGQSVRDLPADAMSIERP